jgi:protein N-terminal methyltransferase
MIVKHSIVLFALKNHFLSLIQFIHRSTAYIGPEDNSRIGKRFVQSLHTFSPEPGNYDLIWIQWVTGQLSDSHFVDFLRRCRARPKFP